MDHSLGEVISGITITSSNTIMAQHCISRSSDVETFIDRFIDSVESIMENEHAVSSVGSQNGTWHTHTHLHIAAQGYDDTGEMH